MLCFIIYISREGLGSEGFLGNKKRPTKPSITLRYSSRLYVHYSRLDYKSQGPKTGLKWVYFDTKTDSFRTHLLVKFRENTEQCGAGRESRTPTSTLARSRHTARPYPQVYISYITLKMTPRQEFFDRDLAKPISYLLTPDCIRKSCKPRMTTALSGACLLYRLIL